MNNVAVVIGTRPEAIKLAPVVHALRADAQRFRVRVVATGQHKEMLAEALADFSIRPDTMLDVLGPAASLSSLVARLMQSLDGIFEIERPDWVLVQGDTATALAGGMTAFFRKLRVAHVEAGLRSGDLRSPFPEEFNRRAVGLLADLHFAPTAQARDSLLAEGIAPDRIELTGNTVVDALHFMRESLAHNPAPLPPVVEKTLAVKGPLVLVTMHRRESFGLPMRNVFGALRQLSLAHPKVRFVFPVHPNPEVRRSADSLLGDLPGVLCIEPLVYRQFVRLMLAADLILSDSGGIQEEAPSLGKSVFVLREVTERPEAVQAGFNRLIGTERQAIIREVEGWLHRDGGGAAPDLPNPYGDGRAAERIVARLTQECQGEG